VRLSADDLLRRDVIQTLMCGSRLEFLAIEAVHGIEFESYFRTDLAALAPLIDDGLVSLADRSLQVTPRGRLLVRSVAMAFDANLREPAANSATPRYSRAV
jgi:oxygen-independent coproporphyrinogen-3 oxidase